MALARRGLGFTLEYRASGARMRSARRSRAPLESRLSPRASARGTPLVGATLSRAQLLELLLERWRVGVEHPFREVLADPDGAWSKDRCCEGDASREQPFLLA